jgi:hypothetical protein
MKAVRGQKHPSEDKNGMKVLKKVFDKSLSTTSYLRYDLRYERYIPGSSEVTV